MPSLITGMHLGAYHTPHKLMFKEAVRNVTCSESLLVVSDSVTNYLVYQTYHRLHDPLVKHMAPLNPLMYPTPATQPTPAPEPPLRRSRDVRIVFRAGWNGMC